MADIQNIYILKEIDDDHIIVVTESNEQLLLEKWTLRFSPPLFEGRYFTAEVSAMWVTIHFEDRQAIKWSIEESLGLIPIKRIEPRHAVDSSRKNSGRKDTTCHESSIKEPQPFLGNGGEIIILSDGTIWKEISYQYLYLYEYYPDVVVCPLMGKLFLGKYVFQIVPAN